MTTKVLGIDVSEYQGKIDWPQVRKTGIQFAIVKLTEGRRYVDPFAERNYCGALDAGLVRCGYHFLRAEAPAGEQAEHFVKTLQRLGGQSGDMVPAIDFEFNEVRKSAPNKHQLDGFLLHAEAALGGLRLIVYCNRPFWDKTTAGLNVSAYARRPLWIAAWGVTRPSVPKPWADWAIWQYSARHLLLGVPARVDANALNVPLDALLWKGAGDGAPGDHHHA